MSFSSSVTKSVVRERSGSVVGCLTRDGGVAGWNFTRDTVMCP